jgi:signal transduction histidine kinase
MAATSDSPGLAPTTASPSVFHAPSGSPAESGQRSGVYTPSMLGLPHAPAGQESWLGALRWFVAMRAVAAGSLLVFFIIMHFAILGTYEFKINIGICLGELVADVIWWEWTRRGNALVTLAHLQFFIDTVAITIGIGVIGGVASPFMNLYVLVILSAGLLSLSFAIIYCSISCLSALVLLFAVPTDPLLAGLSPGAAVSAYMLEYALVAVLLSFYRNGMERQHRKLRTAHLDLEEAYGDLKTLKTRLEEANLQMQVSLHAKSEFLAVVSHELRTPLNSVIGFSDLLLDSSLTVSEEEKKQFLGQILRSGQNLLSVIDAILEISRVDSLDLSLHLQPIDLRSTVAEVVHLMTGAASVRGLTLRWEAVGEVSTVSAEPKRLRQILLNLLDNAFRFTPAPGDVCIRVGPDAAAGYARVEVRDTGPGIGPEHLHKIFEPFYQIEVSTRRYHQGPGLGLTVARAFVELHQGRIWAESEEGHGTAIIFTLPYAAR